MKPKTKTEVLMIADLLDILSQRLRSLEAPKEEQRLLAMMGRMVGTIARQLTILATSGPSQVGR